MPVRPPHPCNHPGCRELVRDGQYCAKHRKARAQQYNRYEVDKERHRFENSARWDRIRLAYLSRHPLCEDCLDKGLVEAATEVHHIDGDYTHNDESNLRALSKSCHSKHTIAERGGKQIPPGPDS